MSTESLCPKCSHPKGSTDVCSKCGLVFSKYLAAPAVRKKTDMNPSATTVLIVVVITFALAYGYGTMSNRNEEIQNEKNNKKLENCVAKGIAYFKEIGSYPVLKSAPDTGRTAESVARERCSRTTTAF